MAFKCPEQYRIKVPELPLGDDTCGIFTVKMKHGQVAIVIASAGFGWEHVSVSRADRCPTWGEMCKVKSLFWDDDDCVIQYHPPKKDHINNHEYCLHLWRPIGIDLPMPPKIMVGI